MASRKYHNIFDEFLSLTFDKNFRKPVAKVLSSKVFFLAWIQFSSCKITLFVGFAACLLRDSTIFLLLSRICSILRMGRYPVLFAASVDSELLSSFTKWRY